MPERAQPVSITCSLTVGEPLRLNRLQSGQVCPSCRDRVLESIPPALPTAAVERTADDWAMGDVRDDGYGPGGPDTAI